MDLNSQTKAISSLNFLSPFNNYLPGEIIPAGLEDNHYINDQVVLSVKIRRNRPTSVTGDELWQGVDCDRG